MLANIKHREVISIQNYHKHTYYSNAFVADCTVSYEDYIKRALELGHKVISSVEHGFQSEYYVPYDLVQKNNNEAKIQYESGKISEADYNNRLLKFVFGAEAYWVKDRKKEYPVFNKETGEYKTDKKGNIITKKDRSNCHIVLLAKNEEGRMDINEALADANIDGYYGQPRLDLELLLKIKPENVMVTTACAAYWKYDDIEEVTKTLHSHFKDNFYLEIQSHNTEKQKQINRTILKLSKECGIDIIYGYDSHFIYESDSIERDNYVTTRRAGYSKNEDDEIEWYMDYPDETTVRNRLREQGVLSEVEIDRCINNTDLILDFDDFYFDKDIKLPSYNLFMTQEEKDKTLKDLVYQKWEDIKPTIDSNRIKEYEEGIEYELNTIIDTKMSDYFLIDYEIVKRGLDNGGIITKTGRGSAVSYYINSLLGFSDIDRFIAPVKLYPDRFMSKTRILETVSLPDIDLNLGNVEVFAQSQDEVMSEICGGEGHSYPMISYKPLQKASAFKLYAKSQGLSFDISNNITKQIALYEKALKHADSEEDKENIDIYDYVDEQYHKYVKESEKYQGIINAKSQAPCGYLIYDGDIKREIGLIRCVSGNDDGDEGNKSVITTVIDGSIAENYKFVKNDLLKVDVWLTINKIFERIGIPTYTVSEITQLIENDKATWDIYANGYTLGVNQGESNFGKQCCMRYKPKNMQELTALVAALRPGFKTQLDNFLDRKSYSTGIDELDNLLDDSFHYIMYQENIMTYLGWLGIEQTETYSIIKKISKKKFKDKELRELKTRLLDGWIKHTGTEDGFAQSWDIMVAFSKYAFNASHAYSYAYDSVYGAYLKAHYPYEFYATMMQHLSHKGDKDKVIAYKQEMQKAFKIKSGDYKFGMDNRGFLIDKDNNCIHTSLTSIKSFSQNIAESLYQLGQKKYDSFVDLLEDMKNKRIANSRIIDLIYLNYFSDFGSMEYLISILDYFNLFFKNKKYIKQYKKSKAFEDKIDFDILRKHCQSETVKMFMGINAKEILKELVADINNPKDSIRQVIQKRLEVLGYIDIIDKKYAGFCVAMDVNTTYSPKVSLYALANGGIIPVKIKKKIFKDNPIKKGDIVKVISAHEEHKSINQNGNFIKLDDKEWWVSEYKIC